MTSSIYLTKKIPANYSAEQAFAMRNEMWDLLETHGAVCDVGIGLGYVDIVITDGMSKSDAAKLAKIHKWKVVR